MSKKKGVQFDAAIFGELRRRVIAHNQQYPESAARLGDAKTRYARCVRDHGHDGALAKIDGWLNDLAKAFEADKHPRGRGGKFAPATPKPQPVTLAEADTSVAEHKRRQAADPGYAAMTTDVIPETRYAAAGAAVRDLLTYGAGAALVASANRSGRTGLAGRLIVKAGGAAGRLAGSIPVGMAAHGTEAALHAGRKAATRAANRVAANLGVASRIPDGPDKPSYAVSKRVQRAAGRAGAAAGRAVAQIPASAFPLAVRATLRAAEQHFPDNAPIRRRIARAAGFAALSGATGALIDSTIRGGEFDPERIGAGIDPWQTRMVQKALGHGELAKSLDGAIERIRATESWDELNKSAVSAFIRGGAPTLLTAGGALAGAAAGAAAAHPFRRGDPYRDSKGRFTSKANAVTGGAALVTGLLGAALAMAAVRGHNVARWSSVATALRNRIQAQRDLLNNDQQIVDLAVRMRNSPIGASFTGGTLVRSNGKTVEVQPSRLAKIADLIENKKDLVAKAVDEDRVLKERLAELDRYGAANPDHYRSVMRLHVNSKIGNFLAYQEKFKLPTWKGKTVTFKELGPGAPSQGTQAAVRAAINKMTEAEFHTATEDLSPTARDEMRSLFARRQSLIDGIDDSLARHRAALESAADRAEDLKTKATDAQAALTANTDPEKAKALTEAADSAVKAHAQAERDHRKLKTRAGVTDPFDSTRELVGFDVDGARSEAKANATKRATAEHDRKIAELKDAVMADLEKRHDELVAASVHFAGGAVPRERRGLAKAVKEASNALRAAKEAEGKAFSAAAAARAKARDAGQAALGRTPKGMSEVDAQKLRDEAEEIKANVGKTAAAHHEARRARRDASMKLRDAVTNLNAAYVPPGHNGRVRLPPGVSAAMVQSLRQAARGTSKFAKFVAYPTMTHMRAFYDAAGAELGLGGEKKAGRLAASLGRGVGKGLRTIKESVGSALHHAVMRGEGENAYVAPGKIATLLGGPIGIAVAADAAKDLYHYARDKAVGTPEEKEKARSKVKMHESRDPLTGGGFYAVTVPHPDDKNERLVLFGEHYKSGTGATSPIYTGAKLSDTVKRLAEQAQRQQQADQNGNLSAGTGRIDVANLKAEDKRDIDAALAKLGQAGKLKGARSTEGHKSPVFRDDDDQDGGNNSLSSKFQQHVTNAFGLNNASPTGKQYYGALAATVHSNQGRILKLRDAYGVVTGYKMNGEARKTKPIFASDAGFGSSDKGAVEAALGREVDRALTRHAPQNEAQRHALLSGIATVAAAKQLRAEPVDTLFGKVKAAPLGNGMAPAATPGPVIAPRLVDLPTAHDLDNETTNWHPKEAERLARMIATEIGTDHLDYERADQINQLVGGIMMTAKYAAYMEPELTMQQAFRVAHTAIAKGFDGSPGTALMMKDALQRPKGWSELRNLLFAQSQAELQKRAPVTLHPRLAFCVRREIDTLWTGLDALAKGIGSDAEEGLTGGQAAVKELAEGAADVGSRKLMQPADKAQQGGVGWAHPSRLIPELASYIGGDALGFVAKAALGPVGRIGSLVLEGEAGPGLGALATRLGATAVRRTVKGAGIGAAGLAGALGGQKAGDAAVSAAYGAAGSKAPAAAPGDETPGNTAANVVGNVVGGYLGNRAGTALGAAAGGQAIGRVIGGLLGIEGGPVGTAIGQVLGGSLGAWAGGHLFSGLEQSSAGQAAATEIGSVARSVGAGVAGAAGSVSRYFEGYDGGAAAKAMTRYTKPVPPPRATAGQVAAMSGGKGGDPYHDRAGRFTTKEGV